MGSPGRGSGELWCLRAELSSPSSRVVEDAREMEVPQNCTCGLQGVKAGEDKRVPVTSHFLGIPLS